MKNLPRFFCCLCLLTGTQAQAINPDGTTNQFRNALKDLPRHGRIGLQNHGQTVWFKDIVIQPL